MKIKFSKIILIFLLISAVFLGFLNREEILAQSVEGGYTDAEIDAMLNIERPTPLTGSQTMRCDGNTLSPEAYRACVRARNQLIQAEQGEISAESIICDGTSLTGTEMEECLRRRNALIVAQEQAESELAASQNQGEGFLGRLGSWAGTIISNGVLYPILSVVGGLLQLIVVPILGIILRLAAGCLDLAVGFTLNTRFLDGAGRAVTETWKIIRNLCNITFIFILLYTAIRTIIGSANANTKKMVANVIIAALLINFSLFLTRIAIDAGNILAVNFYNLATHNGARTMSTAIVNALGISTYWASTGVTCFFCPHFYLVTLIQMSVIIAATFIVLYMALLMIVRSIALIFLMTLSPIGFMGNLFPQISEYSKMWRENLYGQIMIAPVFLLFFYLIIQISVQLNPARMQILSNSTSSTGAENSLAYFRFIFIIVLLFISVKITRKLTGELGKIIEKVGMVAVGVAAAVATGGALLAAGATTGGMAAAAKGASTMGRVKGAMGGALKATKDLATGKLGERTGVVGVGARFARNNFMDTVKTASQGKVDLQKLENNYKKAKKEEVARAMKMAESVGPQEAIDEKKELENTRDNIDEQAAMMVSKPLVEALAKATAEQKRTADEFSKAEKGLENISEKLDQARANNAPPTVIDDLTTRKAQQEVATNQAKASKDTAEADKNRQQADYDFKINKNKSEVAKKMNIDLSELEKSLKDVDAKILEGMKKRNDYISNFEKGNWFTTGLFTKKARKDVANKIRALKGKFKGDKDLAENIKEAMKKAGLLEEEKKAEKTKDK